MYVNIMAYRNVEIVKDVTCCGRVSSAPKMSNRICAHDIFHVKITPYTCMELLPRNSLILLICVNIKIKI